MSGAGISEADLRRLMGNLDRLGSRDLNEITRLSLNDMAFAALPETGKLVREVFDRPTPFAERAFRVDKATPARLTATVERKTQQGKRHFLETQETGGPRPMTGLESYLKARLRGTGSVLAILPASGMRKNRYGNISGRGAKRLIDLATGRGERRAPRGQGDDPAYFVVAGDVRLPKGLWERRGRRLKQMLAFYAGAPDYEARFPFEERMAEAVGEAAGPAVERAIARVLGG